MQSTARGRGDCCGKWPDPGPLTQGADLSVGCDSDGAREDFQKCVVAAFPHERTSGSALSQQVTRLGCVAAANPARSHPIRVRCVTNPCRKSPDSGALWQQPHNILQKAPGIALQASHLHVICAKVAPESCEGDASSGPARPRASRDGGSLRHSPRWVSPPSRGPKALVASRRRRSGRRYRSAE